MGESDVRAGWGEERRGGDVADSGGEGHTMSTLPKGRHDRLEYFKTQLSFWEADPAAAGLTQQQVDAVREAVEQATASAQRQSTLQMQAQSATDAFNNDIAFLSRVGRSALLSIRAAGEARGTPRGDDPLVYIAAGILAPAKGSKLAPPGCPNDFKTCSLGNGELELSWQCKNPKNAKGTMYAVSRQCDGEGPFVSLGVFGQRRMIDNTLPAGTTRIIYRVQGVRSTREGPVATHLVSLSDPAKLPNYTGGKQSRLYPRLAHAA